MLAACLLSSTVQARIDIQWPTPNKAWEEGKPPEDFIQPTQSGEAGSGLFGCARSGGRQFHEGLDLKPVRRDARGEAADPVLAIMDGIVRHVASRSGESSYGRYVVIEHTQTAPSLFSLYAHLARIEAGIVEGSPVKKGQPIAVMGRSAGGYAIPRDRAHLHLEIGLYATRNFQGWYLARRFGSPNQHGIWNGMNLLGVDPLDFFRQARQGPAQDVAGYFARLEPAITLRIASRRIPDFIQRYPALLKKPLPMGLIGGWELTCHWTGLPFAWTPLDPLQTATMKPNEVQIVEADDILIRKHRCKHLVETRRGRRVPGKDLETVIDQIFSLR